MSRESVSVNRVIDCAKLEIGITVDKLNALEALRDDWFKARITSSAELAKRLKQIISEETFDNIVRNVLPPAMYERVLKKLEQTAAQALIDMAHAQ